MISHSHSPFALFVKANSGKKTLKEEKMGRSGQNKRRDAEYRHGLLYLQERALRLAVSCSGSTTAALRVLISHSGSASTGFTGRSLERLAKARQNNPARSCRVRPTQHHQTPSNPPTTITSQPHPAPPPPFAHYNTLRHTQKLDPQHIRLPVPGASPTSQQLGVVN